MQHTLIDQTTTKMVDSANRFQWIAIIAFLFLICAWNFGFITTLSLKLIIQGFAPVAVLFCLMLGSIYSFNRKKLNVLSPFSSKEKLEGVKEYVKRFLLPQIVWGACFILCQYFF